MANDGWISLHRQIQDNFLWEDKPFAKGQAWIDLLLMASHKDGERIYRGHYEKFRRGEVLTSITFLSERWGWQWKTTKRFIKMLEKAEMVLTHGIPNGIAITIVKYDDFQGQGRANDRANDRTDDRADDRAEDRRTIISNNSNNVNNAPDGDTHTDEPEEEEKDEPMYVNDPEATQRKYEEAIKRLRGGRFDA